MFKLEFDYNQMTLLLQVLEQELSDLNREIRKTDVLDYKKELQRRRNTMESMLLSMREQVRAETNVLMT
jgi:oligoendopeptidase F